MERLSSQYRERSDHPNCKDCKWLGVTRTGALMCRFDPPTISVITRPVQKSATEMGIETTAVTAWPEVKAHDWCSRFADSNLTQLKDS